MKKDLQLQLLLLLFVRYFHLIGQFTKIHAINFRWLSVSEHLNVRFSSYNFHVPKYINKMERFYFYLKGITLLNIGCSRVWLCRVVGGSHFVIINTFDKLSRFEFLFFKTMELNTKCCVSLLFELIPPSCPEATIIL